MLKDLLSRLREPAPEPLSQADSRLALAVLLVRVGRSDDDFVEAERNRTDKLLAHRYGLTLEQAAALRKEAEEIESDASDNVQFTRELKHAVPLGERVSLVEALWEVALADDRRDCAEDGYLRLVCRLLGVSDRDSAFARQRVIARTQ